MGAPIASLVQVTGRAPVLVGPEAEPQLAEVLQAATDAIEAECNRVFVQQVFTEIYDGDRKPVGRFKEHLYLKNPPIAENPMPVITENGVAVTVSAGYDSAGTFGALLVPDEGILYRQRTRWATGRRNLSIVYTGGYATPPADIVSACVELTWLLWRLASKSGGWDSYQVEGVSAEALRDLSPPSKMAIARYTLWGRP